MVLYKSKYLDFACISDTPTKTSQKAQSTARNIKRAIRAVDATTPQHFISDLIYLITVLYSIFT